VSAIAALAALTSQAAPTYVGSAACKSCHPAIYARWQKTPMANVVRDPREHPDAIIPDLSKADPNIVKFHKDDIALVYGSLWKQRYFTKIGNDYYVEPAQWMSKIASGGHFLSRTMPTGGRSSIRPTI